MSTAVWRVIGKSVRGASHLRSGLPNQDAVRWAPRSGAGPPLALAVADGHGSADCFRSAVGARLAVKVALQSLRDLVEGPMDWEDPASTRLQVEQVLPRGLVDRWRREVEEHRRKRPFSQKELAALERDKGAAAIQEVARSPQIAYGTTLLAVLVTGAAVLYVQLGDGDILTVSAGGKVARPLPRDERLLGNETTSLCTSDAWRYVRLGVSPHAHSGSDLILVATDGYSNSFRDDGDFLKVGSDLLAMIREDGPDPIERELEGWLAETSRDGSGDDITLGLLYRSGPKTRSR